MTRLLLIEDDQSLGATLVERLEKEKYTVSWAKSAADSRTQLRGPRFDMALVDISLPDGNGFDLAREIKASSSTPIIFLTALNSAENRLTGYELGADEFIPKPFHLKELLLRIQKVLAAKPAQHVLATGDIRVDFESMSVQFPDGSIEYPATRDFKLLRLLIENAPHVVSREQVMKELFPGGQGEQELPTQRTIDNSILRLRQLLRKLEGDYIRSVRGIGYQWTEVVQVIS